MKSKQMPWEEVCYKCNNVIIEGLRELMEKPADDPSEQTTIFNRINRKLTAISIMAGSPLKYQLVNTYVPIEFCPDDESSRSGSGSGSGSASASASAE
jgi:hypothetical protein